MRIEDWGLGLGSGIGNWDFRLGLGINLGIEIIDWDGELGLGMGYGTWGLDKGIGDYD